MEREVAVVGVGQSPFTMYGAVNEKVAFRKTVTVEEIMSSGSVVAPLKMLDCYANQFEEV